MNADIFTRDARPPPRGSADPDRHSASAVPHAFCLLVPASAEMKFQPGRSGNPAGKVRGTKHRVTLLAERLMEDDAQDVVRTVIAAAKGGDISACKLVLDRIAPMRRGAPIKFTLPELTTASDLPAAIAIITKQVANGTLSPEEGSMVTGMLEARRKALETAELVERIERIEAAIDRS